MSIRVTHYKGEVRTYASLVDAVRAHADDILKLRGGDLRRIPEPGSIFYRYDYGIYLGDVITVEDDFGRVPVYTLHALHEHHAPKGYTYRTGRRDYDPATFRTAPVPGVHRRHWHRGCCSQRLHTQQEIRENDFARHYDEDCLEHGVTIRARRRRGWPYLPTRWDDQYRSRRGNNWKHQRRTRYKV